MRDQAMHFGSMGTDIETSKGFINLLQLEHEPLETV